jgi:glycosyltransferase involved in cell wall biosynthesis
LTRLLDSADLRQAFGQQGQAFAEANYNWDVILAKYQAIFDRYF